jgi:hypothetical protein
MYWLIFILPAWRSATEKCVLLNQDATHREWTFFWRAMFVFLSLVIGLRHEVGGDWINYVNHLQNAALTTLQEAMTESEPIYGLLNWLGAHGWGDVYFVNMVCALLFCWGLLAFCQMQPRPYLALMVAVPYLVTVVAMGYTRQGVAIGLVMLGLVALQRAEVWRFLIWIGIAALFHKSAAIMAPLAIFSNTKQRWVTWCGVLISAIALYTLLLKESMDLLMTNYIDAQYNSSGAAIRIAMNALPATIFLLFKRKFILLTPEQRRFWTWMSYIALGFIVLLWLSPSSTAVDRLALYWIPLQVMIWSNVPDALGRSAQSKKIWVYAVIAYSASVLFVWLVFAAYSNEWLPYRFYPWEALWQ